MPPTQIQNESRVTLKDVAEYSGYSLRTVKKVLNDEGGVERSTRDIILAAANELHYTRNRLASALAKNKFEKVAVIYSPVTETYFPEVEKGFRRCAKACKDYGLAVELLLAKNPGAEGQRYVLEDVLQRLDISGVVLQPASALLLNEQINALVDAGKPVITFGADAPQSRRVAYVGPNAYQSGRVGAQVLANYIGKCGKVFAISVASEHIQTQERKRGFLDRMKEHYPRIETFSLELPDNPQLYRDMAGSLIARETVGGLFCADANTCIMGEVLRRQNRQDIPVVGFDRSQGSIDLMKQGFLKVIIEQGPEEFSFRALHEMFELLYFGRVPNPVSYSNLSILTSECL